MKEKIKSAAARIICVTTFPTNGYLLIGKKIVAVDVGAPSAAEEMVRVVEQQLGRDRKDIGFVTATHFHVDHIGGIKRLIELTGAKVILNEGVRDHIEQGARLVFPRPKRWINMFTQRIEVPISNPRAADIARMTRIGMPLGLNEKLPFKVSSYFAPGQKLPGGSGFEVVATPGHTSCSVSFFNPASGDLLSGDTIIGGEAGPMANSFIADRKAQLQSLARLQRLKVTGLFPGHGRLYSGPQILAGVAETLAPVGLASIPHHLRRRLTGK